MGWTTGTQSKPLSPETAEMLRRYNGDTNALIVAWQEQCSQLEALKEAEKQLRSAIFEIKFPNASEGTQRFELGNGYFLKAVYPMTYKVDDAKAESVLDKIAAISPKQSVIADRLCKWKAEVSIREYRALCADDSDDGKKARELFNAILTIKPGMPQLEIEVPKSK